MKAITPNSKPVNIIGNGDKSSDQQVLRLVVRQWRQKLGYYSIFAAFPAMLLSPIQATHADEAKKTDASVAGERARLPKKLKMSLSNRSFLKRQSEYLLPHQKGNFNFLAALGGNDDCPGRTIAGGNYPAAAPYTDSGDTTGANNTVNRIHYYYYYDFDAAGPDLIYTFTLSARGPNPQIEVSTTSGTYKPLIYILQGGTPGACPAGTGNFVYDLVLNDSRWGSTSTVTLDRDQMNYLPLNVPLHLFIDSARADSSASGPYTIRMQDVTIAGATSCSDPNPIFCTDFFVRQHYLDFLSREPDSDGYTAWVNLLNNCPDVNNVEVSNSSAFCDRITVSAAFLGSTEFQLKGYYVFRFYRLAFDRLPTFAEMVADMQSVTGATSNEVFVKKAAYASAFAQRSEFTNSYGAMTNSAFVTALLNRNALGSITVPDPATPDSTTKVTLTANDLVSRLNAGSLSRAQVLRAVADSDQVSEQEFNRAFVAMQYYGYLRRTPEETGYNAWLNYLNAHPQDFRTMVNGFMNSIEYRRRFGG